MYIFTGGYNIYDVMYLINKYFLLLLYSGLALIMTNVKDSVQGWSRTATVVSDTLYSSAMARTDHYLLWVSFDHDLCEGLSTRLAAYCYYSQ